MKPRAARHRPSGARGLARAACLCVLLAMIDGVPPAEGSPAPVPEGVTGSQPAHQTPGEVAAGDHDGAEHAEGGHEESLWSFSGRILNFLLLTGGLIYFLKSPLLGHLDSTRAAIRRDLDDAETTRQRAAAEMREIEARLEALPAELEALARRGTEEIAAEKTRIREAADAERARLLEQTRREIALRTRTARQALVEHAAGLAVAMASEELRRSMTPDDHLRLIDRYAAGLGKDPA